MASLSRLLRRTLSTLSSTSQSQSKPSAQSPVTALYRERDLKKMVEKFKKSSEFERFRTNIGIYENTIRRLTIAKKFSWIEEILEEQKKYKDISKEGFVARLISLYGKSGMFDHAQNLFDEMPDLKCERSVLSFNALLGACVSSKKFDKVDELFRELPTKLSIEPDVVSYNVLIKGFCEMGSIDSAVSMLDEMEKKGLEPDLITFNTLFHGLYGNGRYSDGEKIWALMEKKNVVPNIHGYNSKLSGLASEKRASEAVELVEAMRAKEIKPNVFSFNALIKGFCNEGKLNEAKEWYGEIGKNECVPNKETFVTLVPFLCEKGDIDMAFELSKEIFTRKCLVDEALLQLVVDGLSKESKIEEAKKLLELGKSNKYYNYRLKLPSDE